jgi:hypothetical protein
VPTGPCSARRARSKAAFPASARPGRRYTNAPHGGAFLPITQSIPAARVDAGSGAAAIVAAVDLGWLDQHLASLWRSRTPLLPDSTVAVTDWDGAILARYPETPTWLGRILPEAAMKLIGENSPGVAMLRLPDGRDRLAAYVPASVPPVGVATFVFLTGQSVASRFDISGTHEVELVAGAALLALVLTLLAGRIPNRVPRHRRARPDPRRASALPLPAAVPSAA